MARNVAVDVPAEVDASTFRRVLASPAAFAQWASRGKWKIAPHLQATDDAVMGMLWGDTCDVLVLEEPVRHGKSEYASKFLPSWYLCRWPDRKVGLFTYGAEFSETWGRKARDLVEEFGPSFGVWVDQSSRAAGQWDIGGGAGGGMWTAGVGGPLIGKGFNLAVIDDPLKNGDEARSQLRRDTIWNWWQETLLSRGEPFSKIIVVMSRWHHDDLIGRLEQERGDLRVNRLTFKAIAEDDDPMGRERGEALWPERWPLPMLTKKRSSMGPYIFAAQFQQAPVPEGGEMLDLELAGRYAVEGETFLFGGRRVHRGDVRIFQTVDLAASVRTHADWTVVTTFGVTSDGHLAVLDVCRRRVESVDHLALMFAQHKLHKPVWQGVESATYGLTLLQAGRRAGLPVRELKPDGDKVSRAEAVRVMLSAGRLWLPVSAPWLADFETELSQFPNGRYDDQVDTVAYACGAVLLGVRGKREKAITSSDRAQEHREQLGRRRRRVLHPVIGRI